MKSKDSAINDNMKTFKLMIDTTIINLEAKVDSATKNLIKSQ